METWTDMLEMTAIHQVVLQFGSIIKDGIPMCLKEGPGGKFFNGKENERYSGVRRKLEEWRADEEKLYFLKKFGWLMNDPDVKAYSAKFKGKI